ncbi:hypothetical protein BTJ40_02855 [Microbulbifer sp. A4B17]|uniref:hypothetical protein n=1 Tax=Microbulbifer sp. A4B17 TaxID=359370 RepID=UPI000D52BAF2|nr:hypothetical protein [Microbulbifer sp. A4B17]AWF79840.1 hypothetical protein BTJ40_02855 [Microbulbifer sp. A4B17]
MKLFNRDRLNLVIAVSAIMISLASFYATYLQARAANQQVKIMTMPVIQFSHENYDEESNRNLITFNFHNAGSGPAILKSVSFKYKNTEYSSTHAFLQACCQEEHKMMMGKYNKNLKNHHPPLDEGFQSSSEINGVIIPAQSEYPFYSLSRGTATSELWEKVDKERWNLSISACFCSPLGNCYESNSKKISMEVNQCPDN